jgi:hypothetical protein
MTDISNTGFHGEDTGLPPVMKSWSRIYGMVLGELALLIILFYAFSQYYR